MPKDCDTAGFAIYAGRQVCGFRPLLHMGRKKFTNAGRQKTLGKIFLKFSIDVWETGLGTGNGGREIAGI